jgi:hypothetical protein
MRGEFNHTHVNLREWKWICIQSECDARAEWGWLIKGEIGHEHITPGGMKTGFIQVNVQQEWNKIRVVRY